MIKLMDLPGHSSLSCEMMMLGFGVSEGTFSDATLSFFKKCPLLFPSWGSCVGEEIIQKPQEAFQAFSLLHSKTTHPGPTLNSFPKSQFPYKKDCGNRRGFSLPLLTCLLICFHAQIEHIQRTELGEAGSGQLRCSLRGVGC